jgi:ribosomal protein L37AE/L43A
MVREEGDDKRMAYDYYHRVLCPFCEGGEMRAVNAALARCSGCDETMSHGFFDDLLLIRALSGSRR